MKLSKLYNFADQNTISTPNEHMNDLLLTLKQDSEQVLRWFVEIK